MSILVHYDTNYDCTTGLTRKGWGIWSEGSVAAAWKDTFQLV